MATELDKMIIVADCFYDALLAKVMALSEKKRVKWHDNTLTDKHGTRTKCIFKDGQILNWSTLYHKWVIVKPFRFTQEASSFIPYTNVGAAMSMGEEAAVRELVNTANANHTGNHYRNHNVKVPKQNDGCVRG